MSLTWNETVDLLTFVAGADRRTVGESDVRVWQAVAHRSGWPELRFAVAAAVAHFDDSPGVWLQPGHISQRWRELRDEINETYVWDGPSRQAVESDDHELQMAEERESRETHRQICLHFFAMENNIPIDVKAYLDGDKPLEIS